MMLDLLTCGMCQEIGFVTRTDLGHLCADCVDEITEDDVPLDTRFALDRPLLDYMPATRVAPTVVVHLPGDAA